MSRTFLQSRLLALGTAILAAATLLSAPAFARGNPNSGGGGETCTTSIPVVYQYNGRATVLDIYAQLLAVLPPPLGTTLVVDEQISDTGDLGPTNVETEKRQGVELINLALPPPPNPKLVGVKADILTALTKSMGNTTTSVAQVVNVDLNVNNVVILHADVIRSSAEVTHSSSSATCPAGTAEGTAVPNLTPTATGKSHTDVSLTIAGQTVNIPVKAEPNTTIELPMLATIIVNEQNVDPLTGRFFVNALHIKVGGLLAGLLTTDIIISHADVSIAGACGVPVETCGPGGGCKVKDFMTGGGWVSVDGGRASFGFNGGYKGGSGLGGHLNLIDHVTGRHIKGTDIVAASDYVSTGATSRDITYACNEGKCKLSVGDFGEPGSDDTFSLVTDQGYTAGGGRITKGNIQIHKSSCPATTSVKKPRQR